MVALGRGYAVPDTNTAATAPPTLSADLPRAVDADGFDLFNVA